MLLDIVYLLAAAVLIVPLCQKIGLGSVLGYLLAGVIIGPGAFGLITTTENVSAVSELGVVFLLFIIGLELDPKRLWKLKTQIFAMGAVQVLLVSAVGLGVALLAGLSLTTGAVIGLGLAMSSTAISTQVLKERNLLNTTGGSSAFSILLFQDIAVIPILATLPLLVGTREGLPDRVASLWTILGVIAGIVFAGHFFLRQVFRLVASVHQREVFTALCLLMIVGLAALMQSLGVSMGLGAFLGGVLLANSEYRHAIETDMEPFKGLLLGLFFMAVGMSVDLKIVAEKPLLLLVLLFGVVVVKVAVHVVLARLFRFSRKEIPLFAIGLAQIGEFAFVLFSAATTLHILNEEQSAILAAVVALSMGATPLLIKVYDKWIAPGLAHSVDMSGEQVVDDHPEVIIAGFGRVGQIIGRLLYANGVAATVLDHDPEQIEVLRRFGFKVYYGDATRLDLLEAAGARRARVLVVAVDDVDASLQIVDVAQEHFPHLQIAARARNVNHVYKLIQRKVMVWERETFESSLRLGGDVLRVLGWAPYQAVRATHKFREHNIKFIYDAEKASGNQRDLISLAKQARLDLEKMFAGESENLRRPNEGWDLHPDGR